MMQDQSSCASMQIHMEWTERYSNASHNRGLEVMQPALLAMVLEGLRPYIKDMG